MFPQLFWCDSCFSLGILSVFAYHENFPVLWVSCFFYFSRPMVLLWTLTLAGGNFWEHSLPSACECFQGHFPNQAFCLDRALLEHCDVRWTLLHPTPAHRIPPHPTPSHPSPSPAREPPPPRVYIYIHIYIYNYPVIRKELGSSGYPSSLCIPY